MTDEKVDPAFTTTYEGRLIGFCCEKCLAKFVANPQRYASRLAERPPPASPPRVKPGSEHVHPASPSADVRQSADNRHEDVREAGARTHELEAAGNSEHGHEHEATAGFLGKFVAWLGKFHPPAVNFPIGMIVGAALAELLLMVTGREFFVNALRFCLWVGCLGAVVAAVLGWFFAGFHLVDDSRILMTHRWLGTVTAAWSVWVLIVGERSFRRANASRAAFRISLFMGAALVTLTGFFGGSLIYGLHHYAW